MEYLERKITVFEPSYVKPIYVVQGSNMFEIRITLTDWDIPSGADVYWQVATSTKGELNVADVDGNTIYIRPYTTTFSEAGKGYLQVRVEHDGRVLISFSIDVYIQPDRVSNPTEGSNSDVIRVLVEQYVDDATGTLFEDLEARGQEIDIQLQRTANDIWNNIQSKGYEVLQSIPSDYTELESRVDELENSQITTSKIENGAVTWDKLSGGLKARISNAQGIGEQAISLLIEILTNALYTTDQSANITALEEALHNSNSDVIYQNGEVLTIEAVALEPYQSGEVLIFE